MTLLPYTTVPSESSVIHSHQHNLQTNVVCIFNARGFHGWMNAVTEPYEGKQKAKLSQKKKNGIPSATKKRLKY